MRTNTTRKTTTRKTTTPMMKAVEIHPAERAGIAVHQAVENGIGAVTDTVATGIGYAFGFVKGLVKGH